MRTVILFFAIFIAFMACKKKSATNLVGNYSGVITNSVDFIDGKYHTDRDFSTQNKSQTVSQDFQIDHDNLGDYYFVGFPNSPLFPFIWDFPINKLYLRNGIVDTTYCVEGYLCQCLQLLEKEEYKYKITIKNEKLDYKLVISRYYDGVLDFVETREGTGFVKQ